MSGGLLIGPPPSIALITQGSPVWSPVTKAQPDEDLMLEAERPVGIYTC